MVTKLHLAMPKVKRMEGESQPLASEDGIRSENLTHLPEQFQNITVKQKI